MTPLVTAKIVSTLSRVGKSVVVNRNGERIALTRGIEVSSEQVDDANSLLAQTAQTRKRLMVYPIKQGFQTGDTVLIDKETYTVTKVEEFKPAAVALYVYLEVI